jgi:DinB superfamily
MQFQMNQALEVLTQTPDVLRSLLGRKSALWLNARRTPESFSAIDVLGHLMFAEQTDWMPRVHMILDNQNLDDRDKQTFEPFDRYGFQSLIAGQSIEQLLGEFARLRMESVDDLRQLRLAEAQLSLPGRHPELGHVTLGNLLSTWVVHDLGHIAQIVKTMASEYGAEVGPWYAYTTILH